MQIWLKRQNYEVSVIYRFFQLGKYQLDVLVSVYLFSKNKKIAQKNLEICFEIDRHKLRSKA